MDLFIDSIMTIGARLKQARQKAGYSSASAAARAFGWAASTYASHENGQTETPPIEALERYARAFRVPPEWLSFGRDGVTLQRMAAAETPRLVIVGEVAGGIWCEVAGDTEATVSDLPVDPRFPANSQYLLRVRGTSINRKADSGSLVWCLDVHHAPREPRDGDWVIVSRQRQDMFETTVKQLRMLENELLLCPDSTDERFQTPIRIGSHDGDEVRIIAFVLDFINPATRF